MKDYRSIKLSKTCLYNSLLNSRMIVNDELRRMWKEMVVVLYFPARTSLEGLGKPRLASFNTSGLRAEFQIRDLINTKPQLEVTAHTTAVRAWYTLLSNPHPSHGDAQDSTLTHR
jgi:hypothetical protein